MPTYDGNLAPTPHRPRSYRDYRDLWARAERLEILTEHPLHLDLELTSYCNLRCKMCWQAENLDAPMGFMRDDLFKRLVDEGVEQGLAALKLQIRGESTMHPRVAKLAAYAKEAGVLDVQLTTNGTVLDKKKWLLDELLSSGLDKIIFSIDPEHDESAREIYGAERAPELGKIVRDAMEARRLVDGDAPAIRVQTFALPGQTAEDRLEEMRREFPDVDEYMINRLWNSKWDEESMDGLSADYELMACSYLWTRLAIFWNGDVHMCCRDYNALLKLGDANRSPVREIWLGNGMMDIRRAHLAGQRASLMICKNCDVCTRKVAGIDPNEALWVQREPQLAGVAAGAGI